uniref:Uncharacterized protein n=1 Tax=Ochrobactrum sp. LM19 TaxID=1449781 RepID=A0A0D5A0U1_9HYPH|nr:hypothetical protein [Ochrobactrum sp. LM19]AJW29925.1 hypothetical protein pLM19O1_p55 [Ochrobactrum sp. LM19]
MHALIITGVMTTVIFVLALWRSRNLLGSFLYALLPAIVFLLSIYVVTPFLHGKIVELQQHGKKRHSE